MFGTMVKSWYTCKDEEVKFTLSQEVRVAFILIQGVELVKSVMPNISVNTLCVWWILIWTYQAFWLKVIKWFL